jgi:hypothetical protein
VRHVGSTPQEQTFLRPAACWRRVQPIAATHSANFSAGVRWSKVLLGPSLSCLAMALSLAWLCKDRSVRRHTSWATIHETVLKPFYRRVEVVSTPRRSNLTIGSGQRPCPQRKYARRICFICVSRRNRCWHRPALLGTTGPSVHVRVGSRRRTLTGQARMPSPQPVGRILFNPPPDCEMAG